MIGIYIIRNKVNNKVYIGQSVRIQERLQEHRTNSSNPHLKRSIHLYGEDNFSFDILCECSESELDDKEKEYIAKFNSTDPEKGYNIQPGGKLSEAVKSAEYRVYLSDVAKKRVEAPDYINPASGTTMIHKNNTTTRCKLDDVDSKICAGWELGPSEKWLEAHRNGSNRDYFKTHIFSGERNGFYGRHHSEETKQKIRNSMPDTSYNWRGKHHSEESKEKMRGPRESMSGENNPNYGKRGKDSIMYGRRVINNGSEEKRIYSSELDKYLSSGWKLGRLPSVKSNLVKIGGLSTSGKILMNNGSINKYFDTSEINTYLELGWKVGRFNENT